MYHKYAYKQHAKGADKASDGKGGSADGDEEESKTERGKRERLAHTKQIIMQRILKEDAQPTRVTTPESERYANIGKWEPSSLECGAADAAILCLCRHGDRRAGGALWVPIARRREQLAQEPRQPLHHELLLATHGPKLLTTKPMLL